jgi:hypothetical protein
MLKETLLWRLQRKMSMHSTHQNPPIHATKGRQRQRTYPRLAQITLHEVLKGDGAYPIACQHPFGSKCELHLNLRLPKGNVQLLIAAIDFLAQFNT